ERHGRPFADVECIARRCAITSIRSACLRASVMQNGMFFANMSALISEPAWRGVMGLGVGIWVMNGDPTSHR
ncbi:MAG: hypothetical protein JWL63_2718, partial [Rhodocyclales bacterium]|nr:hypothetical protein [Rhodocyclales bacterium]